MDETQKQIERLNAESLQQQYWALENARKLLSSPGVKQTDKIINNFNKGVDRFMENIANIDLIRKLS